MTSDVSVKQASELALNDQMPGAAQTLPHPPTRIGRLVLILVLMIAGFWGGLGSWAALSPIQSAVIATGQFKVEGDLPVVQHLEGGLVREILVREGQHVDAGQVLAVLADTVSVAQDRILLNQLVGLLAQDQRLAAEFNDEDEITVTAELRELIAADPSFSDIYQAQVDLFRSNGEMWQGQASILKERLAEQKEQLSGLAVRQAALGSRLAFIQDELKDLEVLFEKGLITKSRYTARRDAEVALMGDLNFAASQIDGVRQRIAETDERILQVRRDRLNGISEQRQVVKQQIFEVRQRLVANEDVKQRQLIRAPVAGRVIDLQFTSSGEVIQDGERILQIVPDGAAYIVEGRVRPEDVDQVAEGNPARVRLTAYNFRTTPAVDGTVTYVSADSLVDDTTGLAFYKVNIRVAEEKLAALPEVDVLPGMPAQIMIATGEQTVADYLLSPVLAGLDTALRESD